MGCRIARIDPVMILELLRPLRDRPRTCLKTFGQVRRVLGFAVRSGYLSSNPAASIEPPRYRPARRAVWSPEELGRFLEAVRDHRLGPLFWLLSTTGLRASEALALRWSDVDLRANTVRVERTLHRVRGAWVFQPPKTAAGCRTVALPAAAVEALRQHRRAAVEQALRSGRGFSEDQLVFCGRKGDPLHQRQVLAAFRRLAQRAGLPPITLHGLRHTHASLLLAQGIELPMVARRLGHSTPAVTAAIYSHALRSDQHLAEAVERTLQEVRP
jgi:integrase